MGRNYVEHARELNNPMPAEPLLFLKATFSLIGPDAPIVLPPESERVEHEGEIAVVLRERLKRATPRRPASAVLGVTCANDVTARDLQRKDAVLRPRQVVRHLLPGGAGDPGSVPTWTISRS